MINRVVFQSYIVREEQCLQYHRSRNTGWANISKRKVQPRLAPAIIQVQSHRIQDTCFIFHQTLSADGTKKYVGPLAPSSAPGPPSFRRARVVVDDGWGGQLPVGGVQLDQLEEGLAHLGRRRVLVEEGVAYPAEELMQLAWQLRREVLAHAGQDVEKAVRLQVQGRLFREQST